MARFGYLDTRNEVAVNPEAASSYSAVEMKNCGVTDGMLEYLSYDVQRSFPSRPPTSDSVPDIPNQNVILPNGHELTITGTKGNRHFENYNRFGSFYKNVDTLSDTITCNGFLILNNLGEDLYTIGTTASNVCPFGSTVEQPMISGLMSQIYLSSIEPPVLDTSNNVISTNAVLSGGDEAMITFRVPGTEDGTIGFIPTLFPEPPTELQKIKEWQRWFHFYSTPQQGKNNYRALYYAVEIVSQDDNDPKVPRVYFFKIKKPIETVISNDRTLYMQPSMDITICQGAFDNLQPNAKINIYRMPEGGTEYFLCGTIRIKTPTNYRLQENSIISITINDYVTDELIVQNGEILKYDALTPEPFREHVMCSLYWQDRLFVGLKTKRVYFSEILEPFAFKPTSFFEFPYRIASLTPYNETLVIQTTKQMYVLYGFDESTFVLKEVALGVENITILDNTARAVGNYMFFLATYGGCGYSIGHEVIKSIGLYRFDGRSVLCVSEPVESLLPIQNFALDTSTDSWPDNGMYYNLNWTKDNRYYIFAYDRHTNSTPLDMVYDSYQNAFVTITPTTPIVPVLIYKTKKFFVGRKKNEFFKKAYVTAKGNHLESTGMLTVRVRGYGDKGMVELGQIAFQFMAIGVSVPITVYFDLKPYRIDMYDVVFESSVCDVKIYDYGVIE